MFYPCFLVLLSCLRFCCGSFESIFQDPCEEVWDVQLTAALDEGRLTIARSILLAYHARHPECEKKIASIYQSETKARFSDLSNYLSRVKASSLKDGPEKKVRAKKDDKQCWTRFQGPEEYKQASWDVCCSILPQQNNVGLKRDTACRNGRGHWKCCEFFAGSDSHIRLPALHEPALRLRAPIPGEFQDIHLEQDGFLRPFDESSMLWPSGYLLTLCVSDPVACGAEEIVAAISSSNSSPVAIELGAGIGAPSTALALAIQRMKNNTRTSHPSPSVVAADYAPHGLALVIANSISNGANVEVSQVDHHDVNTVKELRSRHFADDRSLGFSIVMGSSLKQLFLDTSDPNCKLWKVVDELTASNPQAVAVLVHTRSDPLQAPTDGRYTLSRRISGDEFQMNTRTGDSSDFEISIFIRGANAPKSDEL